MRVLICGGGVIGTSIAYFLSRRGTEAIIVERNELACAASGKSGGFLALDWCDGTPLQALARRSFALHASLAEEVEGDWGYRRMTTYAGYAEAGEGRRPSSVKLDWLADRVILDKRLGTRDTTAQVNPGPFTIAMMRAAEARGAKLVAGAVTGIATRRGGSGSVRVEVDGSPLEADAVVIAMGPWSVLAGEWLPLPRVFGLKGHSLVFETGLLAPDALFLDYQEPDGTMLTPEIFPRADGTVWACAISSETPLPIDPADVLADAGAFERLEAVCRNLSPVLAGAKIVARQACFRPVAQDGLPLIGGVPGLEGAFVATGHSVWGILNAPATGEAMAELILDGAAGTIDLTAFDPARLRPLRRSAGAELK